jgi:hypothetical protein
LRGFVGRLLSRQEPEGATRHIVRGFTVLFDNTQRPDITSDVALGRLDEALALIERYQPWRLAHMRRDIAQFLVIRYPCRGAFFPETRSCMTELTFLARTDITAAPVASSILHEGIHARVNAMGCRRDTNGMAREEGLCRRAELEFGLALPPDLGAPVVERARASLELGDADVAPAVDWAEAMRRQQVVDDEARDTRGRGDR